MTDEIYSSERPMNGRGSNIESARETVTTDSNGDGSVTVQFDRSHATNGNYSYNLEADNTYSDLYVNETGSGSYHGEVTAELRGAPASTDVTIFVTRFAERTQR